MALPTSAEVLQLMMRHQRDVVAPMQFLTRKLVMEPLIDLVQEAILPRWCIKKPPHTDDMFQMLQDLEIEPAPHLVITDPREVKFNLRNWEIGK